MAEKTFLTVGADHRGVEKLAALCAWLQESFPDLVIDNRSGQGGAQDNFNLPACRVAETVLEREAAVRRQEEVASRAGSDGAAVARTVFGLLICGSGHGMTIQANRFLGIRAINAPDAASAREGREHSDANVLCLAADRLEVDQMVEIAEAFLTTPFLDQAKYRERIRLLDVPPMLESEVLPELSHFPIYKQSAEEKN